MNNRRDDERMETRNKTTDRAYTERNDEKISVPVVEEELAVGKRTVETGGVRVEKEIQTKPVHEEVNLREEHVTVDRRPTDREVRPEDMKAFENSTIEMRERGEEAVVEKRARVVEEVVVGKTATTRTEQINDTVRSTNVRVQPLMKNYRGGWEDHDSRWREHYQSNYANSGYSYDDYSHAYRYGYHVAGNDPRTDWNTMEPQVRSSWEQQNRGTWDNFKDAIRHGFGGK